MTATNPWTSSRNSDMKPNDDRAIRSSVGSRQFTDKNSQVHVDKKIAGGNRKITLCQTHSAVAI